MSEELKRRKFSSKVYSVKGKTICINANGGGKAVRQDYTRLICPMASI
jgi:hypothetical protein